MKSIRTLAAIAIAAAFGIGSAVAPDAHAAAPETKPFTVIAVVDSGFSPYHYTFVGHQHPWNKDADPDNNIDFTVDPATYISDYPGSTPLAITIPTAPSQVVSGLHDADAAAWQQFQTSTLSNVNMYRFPGTKIIGAVSFSGSFWGGDTSSHGSRSAASAAGNTHGTCQECLFVLVKGGAGLKWAMSQPWIDIVTNSYGSNTVGAYTNPVLDLTGAGIQIRDNMYFTAYLEESKAAVEAGQTVVFSAGNGLINAFDVPMLTYWSGQKGPDWITTVGAIAARNQQTYSGAGKPVDISSVGNSYPSTGGTTANGAGTHSGTSNAAPTVAGIYGKVIQKAREVLGDTTEGHSGGVLASGTPVACGSANPNCIVGDGIVTRAEVENLVFNNVGPSPLNVSADTTWPSTQFNYYYQGHGVIIGRSEGTAKFNAEQAKFTDAVLGNVAPIARPEGEANWFVVDSKCRQRLWGSWSEGRFSGTDPVLSPQTDPIALGFNGWCSAVPNRAFADMRTPIEMLPPFPHM